MHMDAYHILVIVLSVVLAIALLIAVIAGVIIVKILSEVRKLIARAEGVLDNVEAVGQFLKKTAAPMAITKVVANIVETVSLNRKHKSKKSDKEE